MTDAIRLTVVMTHPVQYMTPWFQHITAACPEIDLTVLYAVTPTAEQQGVGFQREFAWDGSLTEGHRCRVLRSGRPGESVHSSAFWGLDVPEIVPALRATRPDVVLLNGWHSITLVRALGACRRWRVPVLYRGDTNLDGWPTGWRGALRSVRTRLLLRQFAGYLAVGQRVRDYLAHFGVEARIFPSPHCVDNQLFTDQATPYRAPTGRAAVRASFGLPGSGFVALFVGKLAPEKRPADLVRAVARLGGDASLLIVGAGKLEKALRDEAAHLGVRTAWAGFLNQRELGRAYAAADCLVLPSERETWGLVVNESMAAGLPAAVSDRVGCAPDLIVPGETGEVYPGGDVGALAAALRRIRDRTRAGHDWAPACQSRVAAHSFARATEGLVAGSRAVARRRVVAVPSGPLPAVRVVACCGSMVIVYGLERMTFEVLGALRRRGAAVHCIVSTWEEGRIASMAHRIGATVSTGYYWYRFDRHTRSPVAWARLAWDIACTSAGLLRDCRERRATHVLVPDFGTALRNAPALAILRLLGVPVILRVANHPAPGRFYRRLWGRILPPLVSRFVANSRFSAARLTEVGIAPTKIATIRNRVATRPVRSDGADPVVKRIAAHPTVLCVGQIAPFKGTHLVVEALCQLLAQGVDVQGAIVGAFPDWPPERVAYARALRARVAAAGTTDRIHFVGEREDVLDLMRAAHVLAAPILQEETFGNVVLEAQSVGLSVVAFPTGGLPELIEHGVTGYLCPDARLEDLVAGLEYFLQDPDRRARAGAAAQAAVHHPESDLRPQAFEDRWWSLFQALGRPRGDVAADPRPRRTATA